MAWQGIAKARRTGYADQMPPSITVSALGTGTSANDVATVDLGVTNSAANSSTAQDDNTVKVNAIMAAMKELGIAAEDLKTSSYNIYPQYDYDQAPPTIVGYEASQTVTVKIRNSDLVGKVLEKAGDVGATNIGGLRFEADDDSGAEADARAEAIAKARQQAEEIAKAMGATLGDVVSYSENKGSDMYPYYERALSVDSAQGAMPSISPGQSEVQMQVYISYSLR